MGLISDDVIAPGVLEPQAVIFLRLGHHALDTQIISLDGVLDLFDRGVRRAIPDHLIQLVLELCDLTGTVALDPLGPEPCGSEHGLGDHDQIPVQAG